MNTHVHMERSTRVRGSICVICGGMAGSAATGALAATQVELPSDGVIVIVQTIVQGASVKKFVCAFCARAVSIAMLGQGRNEE